MKTQSEKEAAFKQARTIIEEKGWSDSYGDEYDLPSKLRMRYEFGNKAARNSTYYKGQHDELWGQDLSGDELLDLVYGDK